MSVAATIGEQELVITVLSNSWSFSEVVSYDQIPRRPMEEPSGNALAERQILAVAGVIDL